MRQNCTFPAVILLLSMPGHHFTVCTKREGGKWFFNLGPCMAELHELCYAFQIKQQQQHTSQQYLTASRQEKDLVGLHELSCWPSIDVPLAVVRNR